MSVRLRTRRLLRRVLLMWLASIVGAVASLMGFDKARRLFRNQKAAPLEPRRWESTELGDGSIATVYTHGGTLFKDMLAAIDAAEERVLLESYIVKGDSTGEQFRDAVNRAAARGVEVAVVYDGFANMVVRPSFFRFDPRVQVLRFPVLSGLAFWNPRRWGRDHRKILVVDNRVGFVGGYNIGALYATQWRDTHLRIEGPSVWDLDNAFVDFWNMQRGDLPELTQDRSTSWEPQLRAHRNVPRQLMYPIRGMYLEAIDRAHTSIDITAAYFIPDHDILKGLVQASQRGVRVRILLPLVSNHVVTDWLSRGFYSELLAAGIEIHRYREHMVHAKTATIDGRWSTIGTANIDRLSLQGNYEINLEILDADLAQQMYEVFTDDLAKADRLDLHEWERRRVISRVYEWILKPLRPLL